MEAKFRGCWRRDGDEVCVPWFFIGVCVVVVVVVVVVRVISVSNNGMESNPIEEFIQSTIILGITSALDRVIMLWMLSASPRSVRFTEHKPFHQEIPHSPQYQ